MTPVERVGRSAIRGAEQVGTLALQSWHVTLGLPRVGPVIGGRRRWRATVQQMLTIGADALPMAAIMSFCIGYVLALQSAAELRRFGALQFVVDLLAISFTRELGALITALAVSGRTASAIAAEVGTMVVTEEIDALRVMGLDPVEFTLAPKYLGALITVPCLTVLSTFCGVFAGYVFLWSSIDMNLRVYFHEVVDSILLRDIWLTLFKSADVRDHHRAGRLHGRAPRPRWTGSGRDCGYIGGREVRVSRHPGGSRGYGNVLPDGMERSRMTPFTTSAKDPRDLDQRPLGELRRAPGAAWDRPRDVTAAKSSCSWAAADRERRPC